MWLLTEKEKLTNSFANVKELTGDRVEKDTEIWALTSSVEQDPQAVGFDATS